MNRQHVTSGIAITVLLCGMARAQRITTFNVSEAGTASGQGTFVSGINELGEVAGNYVDSNNVSHSFLRAPDGKITTFDPPGTEQTYYAGFNGSAALGLNAEGTAVGYTTDANLVVHAYLRTRDGKFKIWDWPGACVTTQNVGCHGSGAWNINDFGVVVGPYEDTSGGFVAHTGIRLPDGKFTTFAVPGSSMQAGQGTLPSTFSGLNQLGEITGLYYDANNTFHGYLRSANGKFADIEVADADVTTPYAGTFPNSLNDFGTIAGEYLNRSDVARGFLRTLDGKISTFDAPGADQTAGSYNGTFPESVNFFGSVTGYVIDEKHVLHGWTRSKEGKFTTFDAPGADLTPGDYNGTVALSNNGAGAIAGEYFDINGVTHGFIRCP